MLYLRTQTQFTQGTENQPTDTPPRHTDGGHEDDEASGVDGQGCPLFSPHVSPLVPGARKTVDQRLHTNHNTTVHKQYVHGSDD